MAKPQNLEVSVDIDFSAAIEGFRAMADAFRVMSARFEDYSESMRKLAAALETAGLDKESTTL